MVLAHLARQTLLIALLVLAGFTGAAAATAEDYPNRVEAKKAADAMTLKQFLARCDVDMNFCRSVVDLLRDSPAGEDGACVSAFLSTSEVASRALGLLRESFQDHPEWASEAAVPNVYTAMAVLWQCKD